MGSYTFTWEHPASEVFVTGTFDDWGKTVKLEKNSSGVFEKTVDLPQTEENVYYKFVKDGEWVTSHTAPTETDSSGNTNNVLRPSQYLTTSSAAPASSTAAMAAAVPTEAEKQSAAAASSDIATTTIKATPGAFPETPGQEPADFSVKPIPASEGAGNPISLKPGEPVPDPSTITSNTVQSTVRDDPELKAQDEAKAVAAAAAGGEQTFGVNPLPATAGTGNPIDLKPGDKVPPASEVTSNTVGSTVRTDQASYENSGAGVPVPASGGGSSSDATPNAAAGGAGFTLPAVGAGMIPESSLPMGGGDASNAAADPGVTIQSAAPSSTTAQLAAQVPLQNAAAAGATDASGGGVPEVVKDSQREAHFDPEASANPEAVGEKKAVERELLSEVKPSDESGEPAPTETAATSATAPAATSAEETKAKDPKSAAAVLAASETARPVDSRDVSPMSKQPTTGDSAAGNAEGNGKAEPTTPTTPRARKPGDVKDMGRRMSAAFKKIGGASGGAEASSSSAAGTPDSKASKDTEGKKKKRGLFGKIKDALK